MNISFIYKASEYQGEMFKESIEKINCSSFYFAWRYLTSGTVKFLDNDVSAFSQYNKSYVLKTLCLEYPIISENVGSKINSKIMYWVGFMYRFVCATYNLTSKYVYQMIKPSEMVELYNLLHTQSPEYAADFIIRTYDNIDKEIDELLRKIYL